MHASRLTLFNPPPSTDTITHTHPPTNSGGVAAHIYTREGTLESSTTTAATAAATAAAATDGRGNDPLSLLELGPKRLVAASGASKRGQAFCFLPLPIDSGLPVLLNGYFELSSNRRDIWEGTDMSGEGALRSAWNQALLQDAVAPLYAQLVQEMTQALAPDQQAGGGGVASSTSLRFFYSLFPAPEAAQKCVPVNGPPFHVVPFLRCFHTHTHAHTHKTHDNSTHHNTTIHPTS
jgi:hypothetical protein